MISRPSKFFIYLSCLILAGLAAGCSTPRAPVASPASETLPVDADEQMLWQKSEQEQRAFESHGLIYPHAELEEYVNQIAARLRPQSSPADLKIRVKVIKNSYLNAFAYPNGMIYIHTGLLARMDNEAQLAAVLAHEITHCTHRHALRAYRKYKDQPAFLRVVQRTLAKTRGLRDMARFMGINGAMAAVSGYTRELEAEADRLGLELMARAGYDPREAFFLFGHMVSEIEQAGLAEPFFLGSRRKVQQRVDNLQYLSGIEYSKKTAAIQNSKLFLAKLDQLFLDNARMDIRLGRFQAARRSVEKYLRIKPADSRAYFLLGEIFRQSGAADNSRRAIQYYRQAISLDSTYAAPYKALGLFHYKKGHRALAKKFFESCLQLSPDSPDKAYIQAYLRQCAQSGEG